MAAVLLFWGWQSGLLLEGVIMALILESSRRLKDRWDLSDTEVTRIWNFSALLGLAAVVLAFSTNEGFSSISKFWGNPNMQSGRMAGDASSQAAVALVRWLPFVFYFFMLAQAYSARTEFPLETLSPFLRYRRKMLLKNRRPAPVVWHYNVSWPYFVLCLFAASAHAPDTADRSFFWGLCVLVAGALWSQRPRGFAGYVWLAALIGVIAGSLVGERGFGRLSRLSDWADSYNAAWLAHWLHPHTNPEESITSIGHIGQLQMSSQIVLRVTPVGGVRVPTYLREATYRVYRSPDHMDQAAVWQEGGGRIDFSTIPETYNGSGRWVLEPGASHPALVHIACSLEGYNAKEGFNTGVLPLPLDCDHLEQCPAYSLQQNHIGTVVADGPGLLEFDASFGSGRVPDSAPGTDMEAPKRAHAGTNAPGPLIDDLNVPDREKPALDEVIRKLSLDHLDDAHKIMAVSHYFAANYDYSFWQAPHKSSDTNETAISRFLRITHRGHCEYFATATVLLLREMNIPARYAVGYVVHEPAGKHYVVRLRDAHAWCLVWNAHDRTWQILDTTPASWEAEERSRASSWQVVSDFFSWLKYEFNKFRYGQSHLRPWLLATLGPILAYFLYQILFHRRRHKVHAAANAGPRANWPGLDSEFYLLETTLARRGLVRRPGESQTDWLRQVVADPAVGADRETLRHLLQLHYQHRFDPRGLTPAERAELSREARECLAAINGGERRG